MEGVSGWHLVAIVFAVATIAASVRILRRIGFSGWWALLAFAAPLNIVGLVVLALIEWPVETRGRAGSGDLTSHA